MFQGDRDDLAQKRRDLNKLLVKAGNHPLSAPEVAELSKGLAWWADARPTAPWHRADWHGCDPKVVECFYSNGRNAPGGRYKTQDGEWRYIGQGPIPAYVPAPKLGRPAAALPATYWNGLPFSIDKLRSLFRKGKRTQDEREIYDELALHVAANSCARAALARELQCDPKAVDRLKGRGVTLLEKLDETNVRLDEVSERLGLFLRLNEAHQEADAILLDVNSEDSV